LISNGSPEIWVDVDRDLRELREWVFSRIWPSRYLGLEHAFENFRRILQDFQNEFHKYSGKASDIFYTRKFYQIQEWDEEKYERLSNMHEFHVDLIMDLTLELTRAANYICDKVREHIDHSFRLNEGILLVESGPYINEEASWRHHKAIYRGEERTEFPYPGLSEFKKIRNKRDYSFGIGSSEDDPEFL
jgi:hypothetical protein